MSSAFALHSYINSDLRGSCEYANVAQDALVLDNLLTQVVSMQYSSFLGQSIAIHLYHKGQSVLSW